MVPAATDITGNYANKTEAINRAHSNNPGLNQQTVGSHLNIKHQVAAAVASVDAE